MSSGKKESLNMHIMCENFIQGYIDEECKVSFRFVLMFEIIIDTVSRIR